MTINYKAGYKYQLVETYAVKVPITGYTVNTQYILLNPYGNLIIRDSYAWDGATKFPDLEVTKRPSLIHDALCQLVRLGFLPELLLPSIHSVFIDELRADIKIMGYTSRFYKNLPDVLLAGLMAVGSLAKGYDNPVQAAPDKTKKTSLKREFLLRIIDIGNYV